MHIHEAINATDGRNPCIRRKSWAYPTDRPVSASVKILPTNSPDGCVILSVCTNDPQPRWAPTAVDLTADDWEVVSFL